MTNTVRAEKAYAFKFRQGLTTTQQKSLFPSNDSTSKLHHHSQSSPKLPSEDQLLHGEIGFESPGKKVQNNKAPSSSGKKHGKAMKSQRRKGHHKQNVNLLDRIGKREANQRQSQHGKGNTNRQRKPSVADERRAEILLRRSQERSPTALNWQRGLRETQTSSKTHQKSLRRLQK